MASTNIVTTQQNPTVRVLAVAPFGIPNYIKVIINENYVAYVEVGQGVFPQGWQRYNTPGQPTLALPPFPSGVSWPTNMLRIMKISPDATPVWDRRPPRQFNDIDATHERMYEYAYIQKVKRVSSNPDVRLEDRSWICRVETAPGTWTNAFMKVVGFPAGLGSDPEYDSAHHAVVRMRNEIAMHQQAAAGAPAIVPLFLGLVTEPGRGVIGYVSELVEDAVTLDEMGFVNERLFNMVRDAVATLHDKAFVGHCDMHGANVLVKRDGSGVFIIDYEHAVDLRNGDPGLFEAFYVDNLIWSRFTGRIGTQ